MSVPVIPTIFGVDMTPPNPYLNPASMRHGVPGVEEQVAQYSPHIPFAEHHIERLRARFVLKVHPCAE
jgi:hypothetical protein